MPEAADYAEASRLLARTAEQVRGVNGPVRAGLGPEVLDGGELGRSVERFVTDAGLRAGAIADELDERSTEAARLADEANAPADTAA